ncbi:MAG: AI-2E family transporter, partial [Pseudomonadota bacterium]
WLVLLSTLGGLAMFGINGFVIGPLVAAVFIVFWQIFSRDYNNEDLQDGEEIANGPHIPVLFDETAPSNSKPENMS